MNLILWIVHTINVLGNIVLGFVMLLFVGFIIFHVLSTFSVSGRHLVSVLIFDLLVIPFGFYTFTEILRERKLYDDRHHKNYQLSVEYVANTYEYDISILKKKFPFKNYRVFPVDQLELYLVNELPENRKAVAHKWIEVKFDFDNRYNTLSDEISKFRISASHSDKYRLKSQ